MGEQSIQQNFTDVQRARLSAQLLEDLAALEYLLKNGKIEKGITRIGAEQEFCLVDREGRPATCASELLEAVNDKHFTSELAVFNLEINLDPFELKGDAFTKMQNQLESLLQLAKEKGKEKEVQIILTGILPTITKRELEEDYMTPSPRYHALNERLKELKQGDFSLYLAGVDELSIKHKNVLFEACNTSFQMHLQIDPDDFESAYNWSQAISGPLLGIASNSPLLLGRELWYETRIGLFQQSIDSRPTTFALKEQLARVSFGRNWAKGTIVDYFKNEIADHRVILGKEIEGSSFEKAKNGETPKLDALNLHNGTIYRWNRPCYGVGKGKAHLRIENRYIPAGPTAIDEMANMALWVGLMMGRPEKYDNISEKMSFRDVKSNFVNAARVGRRAQMFWFGKKVTTEDLMIEEFLPIAEDGLQKAGVDDSDIIRLFRIIRGRLNGHSGSEWIISNFRKLKEGCKQDDALLSLVKNLQVYENSGLPVHLWPEAEKTKKVTKPTLVAHAMSTLLFRVGKHDSAELAKQIMEWKNIHHVPVEDETGKICGLLTWSHLRKIKEMSSITMVADVMVNEIYVTEPSTPLEEVKRLMKDKAIGCLPVLDKGHLVGIITENDF